MRHFDKSVYCACGQKLDYELGSIRWQHADFVECPECSGKRIASKIIADLRTATQGAQKP